MTRRSPVAIGNWWPEMLRRRDSGQMDGAG